MDFDTALALRLILAAGDLDDGDGWEDVPVAPAGAPKPAPAGRRHPKSRTIYY